MYLNIYIIDRAENIENRAAGRKYDVCESCIRDWRKKKNPQVTGKNSNRRAFCGQKARHPKLEKRLCDCMDDRRQYRCAVTSEMCQLKALAITKELGITCFKAILRLCQVACADLASSRDRCGMATAYQAYHPHTALAST